MSFTERFSDRADAYVAGRPSYPDATVDTLFAGLGDPHDLAVVDLGAGTGISSRLLAARGARVFAVEPNAPMRAAAEPHPGVTWVDGTAEHTGLDEASADLVTAFQAFHWFDHDAALREMVRVLRPGGRAALVYNERDERDPFTAGYGELVRRYQTDETERRRADGRTAFAAYPAWHAAHTVEISNGQRLDRAGLHARARSTSYLPQEGPAFAALSSALDALFGEYAVDGAVTMTLRTIVSIGDAGADGA
jgi:SAM-dependent methyltransferase